MLQGEKVRLRPFERDDLKVLHRLWNEHVELVLLGDGEWHPYTLAGMERYFDKHTNDPQGFAIEADGKLIGDVGLHHRNQRAGTSAFGIGIVDPTYVGKGYGRQALNLLLEWAFQVQNYRRIWLTVWATNERAIRAYQASGFVEEGRQRQALYFDGDYVDIVVMGLLRDEWEAKRG